MQSQPHYKKTTSLPCLIFDLSNNFAMEKSVLHRHAIRQEQKNETFRTIDDFQSMFNVARF